MLGPSVLVGSSIRCVAADVVEADKDTGAEGALTVGEVDGKAISVIFLNISDTGANLISGIEPSTL
jgi:hypothetical protein